MDVLQCTIFCLVLQVLFPKVSATIIRGKRTGMKMQGRYCDSKGGLAKEERKMVEEREVAEKEKRQHYFS
jgi:hypothetical protein